MKKQLLIFLTCTLLAQPILGLATPRATTSSQEKSEKNSVPSKTKKQFIKTKILEKIKQHIDAYWLYYSPLILAIAFFPAVYFGAQAAEREHLNNLARNRPPAPPAPPHIPQRRPLFQRHHPHALIHLINTGNDEAVREYLRFGRNANVHDATGRSAVMCAFERHHWHIGWRLIHDHRIRLTQPEATQLLGLLAGREYNFRQLADGPMEELLYDTLCDTAIAQGADVNAQLEDGRPIITQAFEKYQTSLVTKLLNARAQVPANIFQNRPRIFTDPSAIAELFRNYGADMNSQDENGDTPLIKIARENILMDCRTWLALGADIRPHNNNNESALSLTFANPQPLCTNALIRRSFFLPIASNQEFIESEDRVIAALCTLRQVCPAAPRDLIYYLLASEPTLQTDLVRCPFRFHRGQYARIPFMPIENIRTLIGNGMLNRECVVQTLIDHKYQILTPLVLAARRHINPAHLANIANEQALEITQADLYNQHGLHIEQNMQKMVDGVDLKNDGSDLL